VSRLMGGAGLCGVVANSYTQRYGFGTFRAGTGSRSAGRRQVAGNGGGCSHDAEPSSSGKAFRSRSTTGNLTPNDGTGGVDTNAGSGLRGLQDRLAALGGTLAIDSPPGRGTRIEARIPSSPEQEPATSPEEVLA